MGGLKPASLEIVDLGPEDACRIRALSRAHYPLAFDQDLSTIEDNLDGDWGETIALGLERDEELVGYLVAWVADTYIVGRSERVLVIDDLVIEPAHRGSLFRLLEELREAAAEAGLEGIPVEAFLRSSAAANLLTHPRLMSRLGYQLVAAHRDHQAELGEELVWARFHNV